MRKNHESFRFDRHNYYDHDYDYDAHSGAWRRLRLVAGGKKLKTSGRVDNLQAPFLLYCKWRGVLDEQSDDEIRLERQWVRRRRFGRR